MKKSKNRSLYVSQFPEEMWEKIKIFSLKNNLHFYETLLRLCEYGLKNLDKIKF